MHDPLSQICEVKITIPFMGKSRKAYRGGWIRLFEIWHKDPCKDGSDDSCGRFMRSRYGDKKVLDSIASDFLFEWNAHYQPWFSVSGDPVMSTMGITLQMFRIAAWNHFDKDRKKTDRYMEKHLYRILHFAENTCDTLATSIQGKYGEDKEPKEDRARSLAACVYGCILRETRPWWRHPNLHVHHWSFEFPVLRKFKRLLWERCMKCRKTLGWNKPVYSDWHGIHKTCYRCNENCESRVLK